MPSDAATDPDFGGPGGMALWQSTESLAFASAYAHRGVYAPASHAAPPKVLSAARRPVQAASCGYAATSWSSIPTEFHMKATMSALKPLRDQYCPVRLNRPWNCEHWDSIAPLPMGKPSFAASG